MCISEKRAAWESVLEMFVSTKITRDLRLSAGRDSFVSKLRSLCVYIRNIYVID